MDVGLTERIIQSVADLKGVDTVDLPPLYETVDPDGLEQIFQNNDGSWSMTFEYADVTVEIHDGEVSVRNGSETRSR